MGPETTRAIVFLLTLLGAGCAGPPTAPAAGPPTAPALDPPLPAASGLALSASSPPRLADSSAPPAAPGPPPADSGPPPLLDCEFIPSAPPSSQLLGCARRGPDGQFVLTPQAIVAVKQRSREPVAALVGGTLCYLNGAGHAVPVLLFDNGADYFVEGLARTVRAGKIGFIDRALVERIAPRWDFAFPFERGRALVCQGCTPQKDGEHTAMVGGLWGYIDHRGQAVVPVQFTRDKLPEGP